MQLSILTYNACTFYRKKIKLFKNTGMKLCNLSFLFFTSDFYSYRLFLQIILYLDLEEKIFQKGYKKKFTCVLCRYYIISFGYSSEMATLKDLKISGIFAGPISG